MSHSFTTRESNRHKRQISVGESPTKPNHNEILTLTHYQLESLNKGAFLTNSPCVASLQDRLPSERRPKARNLNIKLNTLSRVLPAINQMSLSISKTTSLNNKDMMDYVVPDSLEAKTTSNSSSQRIALSEYDMTPNLLSNHSNISRFQMMGSPTGQEENLDLSHIRQKDYIDSNPHFSKYNKSINMLDKLDASRMILPTRDVFYYPEQKRPQHGLIRKLLTERKDEFLLPVMKIVKENSPESIEIAKDKSFQFKVEVSTKIFPMHVDIKTISGSFEVFVSKSNSIPGQSECDYHWKEEHFTAEYNAIENIKYLYFRVCALEHLHAVITITFSGSKKQANRSISVLNLKTTRTERKLSETRRKPVYEYFHPNMTKLEVEELKEIAKQIKKEKKAKSLSLAGNQNLVEKNIQVAHEFKETKQSKLFQMVQRQAVLAFNSKVKKEIIETERTGHKLYISVRHELKRLEEGWKSSEAKLKQERIFSQQNWKQMLALLSIVDCLAKTRTVVKAIKIKTETQQNSARRIQKGIHSFLARSGIKRVEDGDQSEERQPVIDLEYKILAGLYQALNSVALVVSKRKKMKAIKMIGRMFREMHEPDPIKEALDIYVGKVIRVQNQWRSNRQILAAQIELFTLYWQRYCRILIREELKKRKKDNTEAIGKMTQEMIQRHARNFVLERRKIYLDALKLHYKSNHANAKSVFFTTEVENSEPYHKESNVTSIRPSLSKLIKVSDIAPKRKYTDNTPSKRLTSQNESKVFSELDTLLQSIPIKPKLRIQPTKPELRLIFTKLVKEVKLLGL